MERIATLGQVEALVKNATKENPVLVKETDTCFLEMIWNTAIILYGRTDAEEEAISTGTIFRILMAAKRIGIEHPFVLPHTGCSEEPGNFYDTHPELEEERKEHERLSAYYKEHGRLPEDKAEK